MVKEIGHEMGNDRTGIRLWKWRAQASGGERELMIRNKMGETEVGPDSYHRALHAVYRVWMLTPQGDAAKLVEYEMDQEALEEFVEDYTRFAELLVRIEAREDEAPSNNASISEDPVSPNPTPPGTT